MPGVLFVFSVKFIPLIVGGYYWRHLNLPYKLFYLQVVFAVIVESIGWYIAHFRHQHNIWLFNCFHFLELWLLSTAAYHLITAKTARRNIVLLFLGAAIMWLVATFTTGVKEFNIAATVVVWSAMVVMYMIVLFNRMWANSGIANDPVVWLCLSVLMFYSCNIPYYGLFNYLYKNHTQLHKTLFDAIVLNLNYVRYPLVGWSFYLLQRERVAALKSVKAG